MIEALPPGVLLLLGAPLLALVRPRGAFAAGVLALPLLSLLHLLSIPDGAVHTVSAHGLTLVPVRMDGLAWLWGVVFHLAAFLGGLYALHDDRDRLTPILGLAYAGAAIQAVGAGDLVTLFVGWELTGVLSVGLVWARGGEHAVRVGLRYLVWQVLSGVLLLAGVLFRADAGLPLDVGPIALTGGIDGTLILLAFGIKACFPLLHTWLTDAYPEATPAGTVFLSAFTTKLAIYALLRCFAGEVVLIPVGVVMALLPLVLALRTDDLRRVLAYVLVDQLGFMVVGIGVGTPLALDGVAALAVVHILYKSLLFMALGAVLLRTGTARASQLGGLARAMPWATGAYMIGAWSSLPGLAGFVSKPMITTAVAEAHHAIAYLALELATAGFVLILGVHVPWRAFFRPVDAVPAGAAPAPLAMRAAMGLTAAAIVGIGVWHAPLYAVLPVQPVPYAPWGDHGLSGAVGAMLPILQISAGAAFAGFGLMQVGAFPLARQARPTDADFLDRVLLVRAVRVLGRSADTAWSRVRGAVFGAWHLAVAAVFARTGPGSRAAATFTTRSGALSMAVLLTFYALLFFSRGDPMAVAPRGHGAPAADGAPAAHDDGGSHDPPAHDGH